MSQLCFEFACEIIVRGSHESNELKIARGQLALILALLASEKHVGTLDDATKDLNEKFEDLGKWRGRITLELAKDGIIVPVGVANSKRPSRNRGLLRVWALCDITKAKNVISWLERRIEAKEIPLAAGTASGIGESDTSHQTRKETKPCD